MKRVLENKLRDMIKERETNRRKVFYKSVSLDELLCEKGAEIFFGADDEKFISFLESEFPEVLVKALEKLSLKQKELCRLLKDEGLNVKEASERMSVPRSTLQEEIKRIREIFRNEGLEDYLS